MHGDAPNRSLASGRSPLTYSDVEVRPREISDAEGEASDPPTPRLRRRGRTAPARAALWPAAPAWSPRWAHQARPAPAESQERPAGAGVVDDVVQVGVKARQDLVLLRLRELLRLHGGVELRADGVLDRRPQPVDRLVAVAGDLCERLARSNLGDQLLVGEAEVLGGCVDAAHDRAAGRPGAEEGAAEERRSGRLGAQERQSERRAAAGVVDDVVDPAVEILERLILLRLSQV